MDKKILITGGCGFIGSHLSELLVKEGYEIKVFDRYNSENHYGWLENSKYKSEIEFILGDIRDYDSINNSIKGVDIIIHLAALVGIPYSYVSPLAYIRTNIEGTYNLLESSRQNKVNQLIVTSTSEVYGSAKYVPIDENHPIQAQSPYSASKISADNLARSYYDSFDLNVKILRPFNTYGPRQSKRAVIPTIISQLISDKKQIELGSIEPLRDFTFVEDTCKAFLRSIHINNCQGETFNIGSNDSISIKGLINLLSQITGIQKDIEKSLLRTRPEKSEVMELQCNYDKFNKITNWKPSVNLKKGLKLTYEWILKNQNKLKDIYYV